METRSAQPVGRTVDRRAFLAAAAALPLGAFATGLEARGDLDAFASFERESEITVDHSAWDQLLRTYVRPDPSGINLVDYAAFKSDGHTKLKAYISALEAVDPTKLDRREQFAFWANLYNAKTIDVVLSAYPVETIRSISIDEGVLGFFKQAAGLAGPWKAKILKVNGQDLSLDNIEHDIMRRVFADPRVHYAVNCASIGCPNLNIDAFTGAKLETELDGAARAFVNHPRGIEIKSDGTIVASSIYSWFQVDFGGTPAGVLDHVRKYASPALVKRLSGRKEISGYQYDWSLNDVAKSSG